MNIIAQILNRWQVLPESSLRSGLSAISCSNRVTVGTNHLALPNLIKQLIHRYVVHGACNCPPLLHAGKVIEFKRGGVRVVPAIGTAPLCFDRVRDCDTFGVSSGAASPFGCIPVIDAFTFNARAIVHLAKALTGFAPFMRSLAQFAEIVSRGIEGRYTSHCSLLSLVGRAGGVHSTARHSRARRSAGAFACLNYTSFQVHLSGKEARQ